MKFASVILSIIFSASCFANDFTLESCQKIDKEKVFKEAIIRELLGASLSLRPKCLVEHSFKFIKPVWVPPTESNRIFDIGVDLNSLKIINSKLLEDFSGQYSVEFQVKSTKAFSDKIFKDKIVVATKLESSMHKQYGCAFTMEIPQNFYLASLCYDKQKTSKESK